MVILHNRLSYGDTTYCCCCWVSCAFFCSCYVCIALPHVLYRNRFLYDCSCASNRVAWGIHAGKERLCAVLNEKAEYLWIIFTHVLSVCCECSASQRSGAKKPSMHVRRLSRREARPLMNGDCHAAAEVDISASAMHRSPIHEGWRRLTLAKWIQMHNSSIFVHIDLRRVFILIGEI